MFSAPQYEPEFDVNVEPNQVRFDVGRNKTQSGCIGDGGGDDACMAMIFGKALDVMVQRVHCRTRDDAGLPHSSAEQLANAPGGGDAFPRSRECRA